MASQLNTVSAPLAAHNLDTLHQSVAGLNAEQLVWASGYLAGLATAQNFSPAQPAHAAVAARPAPVTAAQITVLYGSQTGNGRSIADGLHARVSASGATARVLSMLDYRVSDLKKESQLMIVISTHGEGDPPDDAEDFYEFIFSERAPKLGGLQFSVLALGDSSYAHFCETGRQIDQRLTDLGASRFAPMMECDVDYGVDAEAWSTTVLASIDEHVQSPDTAPLPQTVVTPLHAVSPVNTYSRQNPFVASVINVQKLSGRESDKDVRHVELDLSGSDLTYHAGDALGVLTPNPAHLVAELLALLQFDADAPVLYGEGVHRCEDVFREQAEITQLSMKFLQAYAQLAQQEKLLTLLQADDRESLSTLLDTHQVIDIVKRYPPQTQLQPREFVATLRPLAPRLYSISSSPEMYPDEVHLTVAVVEYEAFGNQHAGAASYHLGRTLRAGDQIPVYIESNPRFRLPQDSNVPVILIGAGTGVAPYRAFVDQRDAQDAPGDNWLIYGDRTFREDFLYQVEWQRHLKSKRLTQMDVAFSRDGREKVYVQHRIREQGQQLYAWLERGAHVYVCGDAKHLAPDVHDALIDLIKTHGHISDDMASAYVKKLRREGRYLRDVY